MLLPCFQHELIEAGIDEAGRGCLAGPVFAAAVVLPKDFHNPMLNDSKKLSKKQRDLLRPIIERESIMWAVSSVSNDEIDDINILQASFKAMHQAISTLNHCPELLLVDGNLFKAYPSIPHQCIIRGDATYASIAAASVLAKTYRDEYMLHLHEQFNMYDWKSNKGYGTKKHLSAIQTYGLSPYHRKSFRIKA